MKNDFRITYDGHWYRLQRYVRVWWLLYLGKSWQRVCNAGSDGIMYGLWGYDNMRWKTAEEAKQRAEQIEADELQYTAKEKVV